MVRLPEPLDRVTRRRIGNPIVKLVSEKTVGSKFVEHYDTPVRARDRGGAHRRDTLSDRPTRKGTGRTITTIILSQLK